MEMNDREESRDDTVEASIARDTWSLQEIQKAAHAVEGQLVHIKEALRSGVEDGTFVKSGNTWKVSDEARKNSATPRQFLRNKWRNWQGLCRARVSVELVIVDEIQLVKVKTAGSRKKDTSSSSASRSSSSSSSSSPSALLAEPEEGTHCRTKSSSASTHREQGQSCPQTHLQLP